MFPILQETTKLPQILSASRLAVIMLLFYKWGNEVGWSISGFAHDVGFPGDSQEISTGLSVLNPGKVWANQDELSPQTQVQPKSKPPQLASSRVELECGAVTLRLMFFPCFFLLKL